MKPQLSVPWLYQSTLALVWLFSFLLLVSPVVAAPTDGGSGQSENILGDVSEDAPTGIGALEQLLDTSSQHWAANVAVFALVFILMYAFLDEIRFFRKGTRFRQLLLHGGIAFLITVIASFTGLIFGMTRFLVTLGTTVMVGIFVAVIFVMAASHFYRERAQEYGFALGSEFGTVLLVHAPLIFILTIAGFWAGGIPGPQGVLDAAASNAIPSGFEVGIPIGVSILPAVFLLTIVFSERARRHWVGMALSLLVILPGVVLLAANLYADLQSNIIGAGVGLLIGASYAFLEKGRHHAEDVVAELEQNTQEHREFIAECDKALEEIEEGMRRAQREGSGFYWPERLKVGSTTVFKPNQYVTWAELRNQEQQLQQWKAEAQEAMRRQQQEAGASIAKDLHSRNDM